MSCARALARAAAVAGLAALPLASGAACAAAAEETPQAAPTTTDHEEVGPPQRFTDPPTDTFRADDLVAAALAPTAASADDTTDDPRGTGRDDATITEERTADLRTRPAGPLSLLVAGLVGPTGLLGGEGLVAELLDGPLVVIEAEVSPQVNVGGVLSAPPGRPGVDLGGLTHPTRDGWEAFPPFRRAARSSETSATTSATNAPLVGTG